MAYFIMRKLFHVLHTDTLKTAFMQGQIFVIIFNAFFIYILFSSCCTTLQQVPMCHITRHTWWRYGHETCGMTWCHVNASHGKLAFPFVLVRG